jgi:regulator of cell morphogenesis and NO signaling
MTITQKMEEMSHYTVADVALNFPQAIKILNRYELDYCCKGNKLFTQACNKARLDPLKIWGEIERELPIPGPEQRHRFSVWDAPLLIDFIVQNHHEYVRIAVPQLRELIGKVTDTHGNELMELKEIQFNFDLLADELLEHLPKEEQVIFPAIRRLTTREVTAPQSPLLANIQTPILVMENEHEHHGELLKLMRSLTNHYTPPFKTCPTLHLMYKLLEEFDEDLMQHIHLENNILFPKVKL